MFFVGALEPGKRLLVVAEPQISVHKGIGRNEAGLLAPFQFAEEPKCIRASSGAGIRSDQHTKDGRATV